MLTMIDVERLVRAFARPLLALAAVSFLSIAASGLVAEAMGDVGSAHFVAGDQSGVTYTASRCDYFLEYFPNATNNCAQAAEQHHFGEVVQYRVAMALPGIFCLAGWWYLRRRTTASLMAECVVSGVGTSLFGLAAAALLLQGLGSTAFDGGSGAGQWLSGGIVAAPIALYYVYRLATQLTSVGPILEPTA